MRNPKRSIAPALFVRGALFAALGLHLFWSSMPALVEMLDRPPLAPLGVGLLLLAWGLHDLWVAFRASWSLGEESLQISSLFSAYSGRRWGEEAGARIGAFFEQGQNPNAAGKRAGTASWIERFLPSVAFLPYPYKQAIEGVANFAILAGVGLLLFLGLRFLLAGSSEQRNLAATLSWFYALFIGLVAIFWARIAQRGFHADSRLVSQISPTGLALVAFLLPLVAAGISIVLAQASADMPPPPDLGWLGPIFGFGSLGVVGAVVVLAILRLRVSPARYRMAVDEDTISAPFHPSDVINWIRTFTAAGPGASMVIGSWEPEFTERSSVSAGEFKARPIAEFQLAATDLPVCRSARVSGVIIACAGIALAAVGGLLLWSFALDPSVLGFATGISVALLGRILAAVGSIPVGELAWESSLVHCDLSGTFQGQGGVALVHADAAPRGSVTTTATLRLQSARLRTVGFLKSAQPVEEVLRVIDEVTPAQELNKELLGFVRDRASGVGISAPSESAVLEGGTRELGTVSGGDASGGS